MSSRTLVLWTAAVFATGLAFAVHLKLRFETVQLGFELDKAYREQRKLIESKRLLSLEAASLRQTDRIETVARGILGMDVADKGRIVMMERAALRTAGRTQ